MKYELDLRTYLVVDTRIKEPVVVVNYRVEEAEDERRNVHPAMLWP